MNSHAQSIAQMAQHFQTTQDEHNSPNGLKRKAEDEHGGQTSQRSRRNRYVSIACNECKRRKIKCNGESPCQRCGNLSLECVYSTNCCIAFKDSQEYKEMAAHIIALQEQVADLYSGMNAMRDHLDQRAQLLQQPAHTPIDPSLQSVPYPSSRAPHTSISTSPLPAASMSPGPPRSQRQNSQSTFRGPTSTEFNFGVAQNSLQTMGIICQGVKGDGASNVDISPESPPPETSHHGPFTASIHPSKDPIWAVTKEEALRLCRVYEDEIGLMYPVLDINEMVGFVDKLYRFMDAVRRSGLFQPNEPGSDRLDDEDTNLLKLLLGAAMTVEASGRSELGLRLVESVQPAIDRMVLSSVTKKNAQILAMAAMFEFHRDDEGAAWRLTGLTARMCIELGLHRRETYDAIKDEKARSDLMSLFWAIYILDRRWSFGTGMPFALQDSDIDPNVPKPEDTSPYLCAMIQYSAISSEVWRTVATVPTNNSASTTKDMAFLDYQILQWHQNLPAEFRYEHPSQPTKSIETGVSRPMQRVRILMYLRTNSMRIQIYRGVLHSATSIMQHREQARTVVGVAKDTMRVLTHVNQTSDIYRTQQVLFNAFLTSALAVLFLAVSHTPAVFADQVREEFFMALDLVRGFSKGSWVSKKLWKTIRVLKDFAPRLGLGQQQDRAKDKALVPASKASTTTADFDPNHSAAVAMAGLAGHNVDEIAINYRNSAPGRWMNVASVSPEGMADDLTSLFEAAGVYQENIGDGPSQDAAYLGVNGASGPLMGEDDLRHIFKELF